VHHSVLHWAKGALPMEGTVLEVGSLNVNGSLRSVLPVTHGIDIRPGKDVDEVLDACNLLERYGPESWDNVVTSNCFEHVELWEPALRNSWGVLKTGGKFLFEVPTQKKGFHSHPYDYWRWTIDLLKEMFKDQEILELGYTWNKDHGVGVICRKVCELNYVQPLPVLGTPRPKKEKKK
jgi:SAM-dependent methyltransferase